MEPDELIFGIDDITPPAPTRKRTARAAFGGARNRGAQLYAGPDVDNISESENDDAEDDDNVSIKPEPDTLAETPFVPSKQKPDKGTHTMVIAVDFGMTYSALSFCLETTNPEDVLCLKSFPGTDDNVSKVPTIIAYKDENKEHEAFEDDDSPESVFGYQVTPDMKSRAFAKLSLANDAPKQGFDDPALQWEESKMLFPGPGGRNEQQVVVDCLRCLKDIVFNRIQRLHGVDFFNKVKLRVVVTHPAAFNDQSKDDLYDAAIASGFRRRAGDELKLASESDSSAMAACVFQSKLYGSAQWVDAFKNQSGVLVLDIGGLTCDATTLKVTQSMPKLLVAQTCPPQGGNCGVVALHCRFRKHLVLVLGDKFEEVPEKAKGPTSNLSKDVEKELRAFGLGPLRLDKIRRFRLPMADVNKPQDYDDTHGQVLLTGHEIKGMLDRNLKYIKKIIDDQFAAHNAENLQPIATVVLCGGGSKLPYIFSEISAYCQTLSTTSLNVIQPQDALAAAVEGANMSALKTRVLATQKSRASYGVQVNRKFEVGDQWDANDIFQCRYGGRRVKGFMAWHMKKGDTIDLSKPRTVATIEGYTMLNIRDLNSSTVRKLTIYGYGGTDRVPPERREHPGVSELGYIPIRLSDMKKSTRGRIVKEARYSGSDKVGMKIVQRVGHGCLEFEARIGRVTIGRYRLNYHATRAA